jgi:uncharacterized integral membrane protein
VKTETGAVKGFFFVFLIILLLISVIFIVVSTCKFHFHPFLALLFAAVGFGETIGSIGIVIIGTLLEHLGNVFVLERKYEQMRWTDKGREIFVTLSPC